jgi:ornithine cyclodeaminase/alanine dehydrogenase
MMISEILYLSRRDLLEIGFDMKRIIIAVEKAIRRQAEGSVSMPPKTTLDWGVVNQLNGNAAYLDEPEAIGIKWDAQVPSNIQKGWPNLTAVIVLNDPQTGFPMAFMDGTWITAMRTGAVSAVAARHLAPECVGTLGLIGCGLQMRAQILALKEIMEPDRVLVYDQRHEAMVAFAGQMVSKVALQIQMASSAAEVVRGSEVVVSAIKTLPGNPPPLKGEWLQAGSLALPIDGLMAWDLQVFSAVDKFIVSRGGLRRDSLGRPIDDGLPEPYAVLHEIVTGAKPGRESQHERILAMNVGMPITDMAVAKAIYDYAIQAGKGLRLPFIESIEDTTQF